MAKIKVGRARFSAARIKGMTPGARRAVGKTWAGERGLRSRRATKGYG